MASPHRLAAVLALALAPVAAGQEDPAERGLETVRERVLAEILAADASSAAALRADLGPDGRFEDLEGGEVSDLHLRRLETMAVALRQAGHPLRGDPELRAAIGRGLDSWIADDPRHSNWWVNEVAVPRTLGRLAVVLGRELAGDRLRGVDRLLERAWPPPGPLSGGRGAAANLFYRVDAGIARALVHHDPRILREVVERAAEEIRVVRSEGIQADRSFHQHGPQFYSGSYGLEYARVAARLAVLVDGTDYALPADRIELVVSFVLDGLAWIVCGPMIDPGAQGRNFSRLTADSGGAAVAEIARTLARLDLPRRGELEALAGRLVSGPPVPGPPYGNKSFWRSDFLVHRRPGWYASTKMASSRTKGTESGNGEGTRQYHLADGAHLVMRDGTEYAGIQPVWDWRRIPGITCEQDDQPLPLVDWGWGARGKTAFAGGVSDGTYGVAALDYDRDRVRARKAWFYFDDEAVSLGAGIAGRGEHPVVTTLDQRLLEGDVLGPDLAVRGRGRAPWVLHDGTLYLAIGGENALEIETAERSGDWYDVNRRYGSRPVRLPVFTAWIDHGVRPSGASYAYAIRPDLAPDAVGAYAAEPPFEVLANTPGVQAVRHRALGVTGIAFHEAGRLAIGDLEFAASAPCLLLVAERPGELVLSAANPAYAWPDREPFELEVGLERGFERSTHRLALEDGRTSTIRIRR